MLNNKCQRGFVLVVNSYGATNWWMTRPAAHRSETCTTVTCRWYNVHQKLGSANFICTPRPLQRIKTCTSACVGSIIISWNTDSSHFASVTPTVHPHSITVICTTLLLSIGIYLIMYIFNFYILVLTDGVCLLVNKRFTYLLPVTVDIKLVACMAAIPSTPAVVICYYSSRPTEGRRLSRSRWLSTSWGGLPARRRPPSSLLTGPDEIL